MIQFKVKTEYPVAFDSPDHLYPWGTKNDNHTNMEFTQEIENHLSKAKQDEQPFFPINIMDIGCSGGKFIRDMHERGHNAIGIEGSDFSAVNGRAEWADMYNKILFTCDASRDYEILNENNERVYFEVITAWEVIEHIAPERIDNFFKNIYDHLYIDGFFVGSISVKHDSPEGQELHLSLFDENTWKTQILNKYFEVLPYPFKHKVRDEHESFYVMLKKKRGKIE